MTVSITASLDELYAFQYTAADITQRSVGWNFFDLQSEYLRMGVPNDTWVLSLINKDYEVPSLSLFTFNALICVLLTHWLIIWSVDWFIDWLINWSIDWLIYSFIHLCIDWSVEWLIDWFIDWFIYWSIDWLTDWLIYWFIDLFIYPLIDWLIWVSEWDNECLFECIMCLLICICLFLIQSVVSEWHVACKQQWPQSMLKSLDGSQCFAYSQSVSV